MLPEEIPTYISTVLEFCGKPDFSFCLPDLNARKEPGFWNGEIPSNLFKIPKHESCVVKVPESPVSPEKADLVSTLIFKMCK